MNRILDKILATGIAGALFVFFAGALLYPLSNALIEAIQEPRIVVAQKGDTFAALAQRLNVSEDTLRKRNNAPKDEPKEGAWIVYGDSLTLRHIFRIFDPNASQWRWIVNSLLLAGGVTVACALVAYPLAYLQARTTFYQQSLLGGLLLVPLVMPPFVGAIGLRRMLSKYGTINLLLMKIGLVSPENPIDFLYRYRLLGCMLVMTLHFYPLLYLNLAAAISNIDPSLLESARSLGLTRWQIFKRVVLPLSKPGLIAGGSLVFIGAFTDLGTPLIFGYQETVARQIFALANEQVSNPAAPALVAVVTALVLGLFILTRWSIGRGFETGGVKGQTRASENRLCGKATTLAIALHLVVIAAALLPHLAVVLGALGDAWFMVPFPPHYTLNHMNEALSSPVAATGMRNSLIYALASTVIDVALGLACAWVIVRRGGLRGRIVDALTLAPLAVPGLVLAFGYVGAYAGIYSKPQDIHFLGLNLTHLNIGVGYFLILSYAVRRLPYTVRSSVAGLEQTPHSLEEAAGSLGATPTAVIFKVTLPLIVANIAAGAILAFSFAMLEVSDSIVLAVRPEDVPLTKAIYNLFGNPGNGDQLASALGLVALVFLSMSLLAAGAFMGKRWGQMFKG
jgi:iron(III) transport system permease protein